MERGSGKKKLLWVVDIVKACFSVSAWGVVQIRKPYAVIVRGVGRCYPLVNPNTYIHRAKTKKTERSSKPQPPKEVTNCKQT